MCMKMEGIKMNSFRELRDVVKEVSNKTVIKLYLSLVGLAILKQCTTLFNIYPFIGFFIGQAINILVSYCVYYLFLKAIRNAAYANEHEIVFERKLIMVFSTILIIILNLFIEVTLTEFALEFDLMVIMLKSAVNLFISFVILFTVFSIFDNYQNIFNIIVVAIRIILSEWLCILVISLCYILWQVGAMYFLYTYMMDDIIKYSLTEDISGLIPFLGVNFFIVTFIQTKMFLYGAAMYERN